MTSAALDAPLRSLCEALDQTEAEIKREFDAVRRLYGLIDQRYRPILELQQRAAMLKAEIHRRRSENASPDGGDCAAAD